MNPVLVVPLDNCCMWTTESGGCAGDFGHARGCTPRLGIAGRSDQVAMRVVRRLSGEDDGDATKSDAPLLVTVTRTPVM